MANILIVEDEVVISMALVQELQDRGHKVVGVAPTGAKAVKIACDKKPDVVLMDISLRGDMTGVEAAEQLRDCCGMSVVFMTGQNDPANRDRAQALPNALGYLVKPVRMEDLDRLLEQRFAAASPAGRRA